MATSESIQMPMIMSRLTVHWLSITTSYGDGSSITPTRRSSLLRSQFDRMEEDEEVYILEFTTSVKLKTAHAMTNQ